MAVRSFLLPDLGEGLQEAEVIEWHVGPGDRVVADQPLLAVETDKAVVEIPSPWSGRIRKLVAVPGSVLPIGAVLAEIEDEARAEDKGAIVGDLEADTPAVPQPPPGRGALPRKAVRAAPAARARAQELGLDLASVAGSGPDGQIMRADVEAAAAAATPAEAASATRRSMARAMAQAHAQVVPASLTDVADVTAWISADADVTVRLLQAVCAGIAAEPAMNRWYDPEGAVGAPPDGVHIGLAVDAPRGLYVPVIPSAEGLSAAGLRRAVDAAVARVRTRRPDSGPAQTPTITLSNFGRLGGRHAVLVVVPPQAAILGAGRAYETVAWRNDAPARAVLLPLSLTFDHRAVTGGEAARFLAAAIRSLEQADAPTETP